MRISIFSDVYKRQYNDVPYESAPFETIFASATERQKQMLAWILANCYPAVSAQATFELTGTDYAASPVLDDNDAYAAVQVALWVLLGQIAPDEVNFLECSSTEQHPKSVRLRATVLRLLELAGEFADDTANPAPPVSANTAGCCTDNPIDCCNTGTIPTVSNKPYLVFKGCPDEVRTVCGRLLIGPFMLLSFIHISKMDDAQEKLQDAKFQLQIFQCELKDVELPYHLSLEISDFLTFADFFFDGIVADWLVQSRINDAKAVSYTHLPDLPSES